MVVRTIESAKGDFAAVLEIAIAGETVVLCDESGKERAVLAPAPQPPPIRPSAGLIKGPYWMAEDFNASLDDFGMEPE